MDYKFCVFIGRFQPLHNSHLEVIKQALTEAERLILVIGSCHAARNIKNPFTYEERKEMISTCLTADELSRISFVPIRDYYYSDNTWVTQIQQAVNQITHGEQGVSLIGSYKDSSSYYIKLFPQWDFIPARSNKTWNATDVRRELFTHSLTWSQGIPNNIARWIDAFKHRGYFQPLVEEYAFIESYKAKWANVPFPVTFNTVDAVLIQSGHVLVVRRKFNPGKGLIALPGGFIKQNETLQAAAIRELKEETGIKVANVILTNSITDSKVFDHPGRSLRGRTITHAFCISLGYGELPEVRASDDAEQAFWLPLMDLGRLEDQFYEDHASIIQHFTTRF